jgi:Spy/CpxP family protein refolding chaperone
MLGLAVLAAGLAAGPVLAAESEAAPPKSDNPKQVERKDGHGLAGELGLSAEKAAEVKNIIHETRKAMIKLKADRDLARADLNKLFEADKLDEKAITAAAEKLAQVNGDLTRTMVKGRLAVSALLTPEQRERMHGLRKGMLERFKERRGGMHGGRGKACQGGEQSCGESALDDDDGLI